MAITGTPTQPLAPSPDGPGTLGIAAATWHPELMDALLAGARHAARDAGAEITVVRVPGTFELPLAAQTLARSCDAVVALGVVIRGETPHFDYICSGAVHGLMTAMLTTGTPIGNGILTCDTEEQARDRAGLAATATTPASREDKGYEAAEAAIRLFGQLATVR